MFREGRLVIKKMFSFRNIQIRVDGALMFNATLYMYNPTCYEFSLRFPFIFPSSCCFSLVFLFLPLFSLVVGYNFFVCFFFPNVFGTVISGVSCTLANNRTKLFCTGGGGGTYLKTGAIRTFTVHVFHLIEKRPSSLSAIKFSCLISCYLHSVPYLVC